MRNVHTPLRENMHERTTNLKVIVKRKLTSPKNRRIIKIIPPIDQLMKRSLSINFYLKVLLRPYYMTYSHKKYFFLLFYYKIGCDIAH
jgi:hypothetical protein